MVATLERYTDLFGDAQQAQRLMYRSNSVARFEAITPHHPAVVALREEYPAKRAGQTACSQSHLGAWAEVAKISHGATGEEPLCLVLEDDVRFHKDWRGLLTTALETLTSKVKFTGLARVEQVSIRALELIQSLDQPCEFQVSGAERKWSGLLYLDAVEGTGWVLGTKGLVVAEQVRRTPRWPQNMKLARLFMAVFLQECMGRRASFGPT
jgi:hypothetical protein